MKKTTGTATKTATVNALTPATTTAKRITATATGRELKIADSVSGAEIRLVVNAEGGIERELTKCEKHDK